MDLIDSIIVNVIYIAFPLLCYLFYISKNESFSKKNNELFLELALFSSIYLCLKLGNNVILLVNIPLIISYIKKRNICSIIFSIIIVISLVLSKYNLILTIIEYIFYYFCYLLYKNRNLPKKVFIILFILIKSIIYLINNINIINEAIINILLFIIISIIILIILKKSEDIANIHQSIKDLEQEKVLRKSLFKITHEIKNPIAVCKGYLDMFDGNNKRHIEKYIPIVKQEINRTLTIMNDFMELSKIKLELEIMDIVMLLEEVLNTYDNLISENNIKFNYEILDEEIYINGDYNRLKQVLINIIKNSIEALDGINNGIIILDYNKIKDKIIIEIKDNGIGMSDEVKERIFEAFYTTKKQGTGLGVNFSKEIIEGHNGIIDYESEENKGTKVKIILPIVNFE